MSAPTKEDRARLNALLEIADTAHLDRATVMKLIEANPSAGLPYHGTAHAVTVALRSAEQAAEHDLPEHEVRALIVAGLCHDAEYRVNDFEENNIRRATWFVQRQVSDWALAERAITLVRATKFPHAAPRDDAEAIIQDSDLLQTCEPDAERFYRALRAEGTTPDRSFPGEKMLNTFSARKRYANTRP